MTGARVGARLELVEHSLELVAGRDIDIVPLVYRRLFAERPELRALFAVADSGEVRSGMGNMVNEVLRLMLAGTEAELQNEAQAAVVFHVGWGLRVDMYRDVLLSLMAAVREGCAEGWTAEIAAAWYAQLERALAELTRQFDSIEGPSAAA
jgi:hemoglobin-like flavoprotein